MIGEGQIRAKAAALKVPAQVICTTCGQASYSTAHFGHRVTRLSGRLVATSAAPRTPAPRPTIEWITVADVAHELGVAKMTAYRLVHSGALPAHRIGRSFRIKREAFDAYLAGTLTVEPAGE